MKRFSPGLVAVLALVAAPAPAHAQKTVILVRHADRDPVAPDSLTEEGRARAAALARALKDTGLTAIVRSDTERGKETAEPTARQFHVTPKVVKYDEDHVKNAFDAIRASGQDAVVLYVGHSDTLEPILRKFGYQGPFSLDDPFGNLVVLIPRDPTPSVVRLHYSSK